MNKTEEHYWRETIKATLKVLVDGQAYLYATLMNHEGVLNHGGDWHGGEKFRERMIDDWKQETDKLIREIVDGQTSNPS